MSLTVSAATLYDFPYSSSSYRLRIALALKGVAPHKVETVNLRIGAHREEAFVATTGAPLLPAMDFGEAAYGQSIALIEWLDQTHPDPRLLPEDATQALTVRSLALAIGCDIHPLNTPRVLTYLGGSMDQPEQARKDWYAHWVREGFATLERQLTKYAKHGPFCFGTQPTLADICLVPQVLNARRFGVDVDEFTRINAVNDHCKTLAAFQSAAPPQD